MSVSDGQPVNATITNAAYVSRTDATTSTNSILQLLNNTAASGDTVTNLQAKINEVIYQVPTSQTVAAAATITLDTTEGNHLLLVSGDSGAQVINSTPFGSDSWINGTLVKLVGTNDTNTLTITHNDAAGGAVLNGNATLSRFDCLTLQYSSELDRWLEINRNF